MTTTFFKPGIICALALIFVTHQSHARTFKDLRVRNCLQAGSLNVCRNALINGNLRVNGTIFGPTGAPFPAFDVDNGSDVVPVNGIVQVSGLSGSGFVPSGIETHNGGTNDLFIEDRRWVTQYVVDPSAQVGARGTFQTIQGAIDAVVASGQKGFILVRPGTYIEDLILHANVDIQGACAHGLGGLVTIIGNHTYDDVGTCALTYLTFLADSGDIFTIAPTGAGLSYFLIESCVCVNTGGGVSNINPGVGNFLNYFEFLCISQAFTQNITAAGSRGLIYATKGAFYNINVPGAQPMITVDGNARVVTVEQHHFGSGDIYHILSAGALAESYHSEIFTNDGHFIDFQAPGNFIAEHITLNTQASDGFTVVGAGTYQYGDVLNTLSTAIAPATTKSPENWQPYATAGTQTLALGGAVRGTSAFNETQFSLTDGFVNQFSPFFAGIDITDADSPYDAQFTDSFISVDPTGGPVTVNLPASTDNGRTFTIKNGSASANVITIASTAQIDGAASQIINTAYGSLQVRFNGTTYQTY